MFNISIQCSIPKFKLNQQTLTKSQCRRWFMDSTFKISGMTFLKVSSCNILKQKLILNQQAHDQDQLQLNSYGPHASFNKCWSECHGSSLSASLTKFYRMLFNMQFFPSQYCFRYEKALVFYPLKKQKKLCIYYEYVDSNHPKLKSK